MPAVFARALRSLVLVDLAAAAVFTLAPLPLTSAETVAAAVFANTKLWRQQHLRPSQVLADLAAPHSFSCSAAAGACRGLYHRGFYTYFSVSGARRGRCRCRVDTCSSVAFARRGCCRRRVYPCSSAADAHRGPHRCSLCTPTCSAHAPTCAQVQARSHLIKGIQMDEAIREWL